VVAGVGWGSGSSREQAVWALRGAGIQVVIAQSYAFIHKRNLVNEALPYLVVTAPRFHELAAEDAELSVDLAAGTVTHVASGLTFKAERPSPIVQALQREGGLVPAIRHHGPPGRTGGAAQMKSVSRTRRSGSSPASARRRDSLRRVAQG
jgi:aconitate hydratase/homoaconitate hydratase